MRSAALRSVASPRDLAVALFGALLWLARFSPPTVPRGVDLDESWQQVYPYFHSRGLQAGVDYVFSYGPLAFLEIGSFTPELFWLRVVVWELGFELAIASLFALAAREIAPRLDRALFMLASLLAAAASDTYFEAYRMLALAIAALSLLGEAPRSRARRFTAGLVLAVLSLVKFPYLVLSAAAVAAAALARGLRPPRARALAGLAASSAAALALAWVLAGQRLRGLPAYLSTSLALTAGFSQGMYTPAYPHALLLALAALGILALLLALRLLARPRSAETALACAFLALAALLAYKSSFVLFDNDGAFAAFAAAAAFLPPWPAAAIGAARRLARLATGLRCACFAISLLSAPLLVSGDASLPVAEFARIGERWRAALGALGSLRGFEASQRARLGELAATFELPRIRALVGDQPVDVVGSHQAVALLNGFDYRPRPVFQSYAAFTPELMERNRRFLAGEAAPGLLLSRLRPMSWRLPALEDAAVLLEMLRDFEPLVSEGGFVLWRRVAPAGGKGAAAREPWREQELELGQWLALGGGGPGPGALLASIEVEPTWLGRLRELAYQPGELTLEVATTFGDSRSFRLGTRAPRTPFLLDPLLSSDWDLVRWVAGLPVPRPRALRIAARGGTSLYRPRVRLRIGRAPDLEPRRPPGAPEDFAFAMLHSRPTQALVSPLARTALTDAGEILVVGTPSELRFDLGPGQHVLEATFGLALDELASANGATFSVALDPGERVVYEWTLDPDASETAFDPHTLRLGLLLDGPRQLSLRARPRTLAGVDLAYWREVAIDAPGAAERLAQSRMR